MTGIDPFAVMCLSVSVALVVVMAIILVAVNVGALSPQLGYMLGVDVAVVAISIIIAGIIIVSGILPPPDPAVMATNEARIHDPTPVVLPSQRPFPTPLLDSVLVWNNPGGWSCSYADGTHVGSQDEIRFGCETRSFVCVPPTGTWEPVP